MALPNYLANQKPTASIRGLSEQRRLPRLGKIRLGVRKVTASGAEYPAEVDYFVCPPEVQGAKYPDGTPYGEKPKKLRIMFPVSNREAVFPQALKRYGRSQGLLCRGDGDVAFEAQADGTLKQITCPCHYLEPTKNTEGKEKAGECSPVGNLMCFLPDVSMAGCYQIDTGSIANITRLNSYFDYVVALVGGFTGKSTFALIPLWLHRVKEEMQSTKRKAKSTHYLLRMELDAEYLREISRGRPLLPMPLDIPLVIPPPEPTPPDEPVKVAPPIENGPDAAPGAVVEMAEKVENPRDPEFTDPEKELIQTNERLEALLLGTGRESDKRTWKACQAAIGYRKTIETKLKASKDFLEIHTARISKQRN